MTLPTTASFSFISLLHIFTLFHLLLSPVFSFYLPRGLLFEEKTRLGSMPPSCHNKCNQCHPCIAAQVPSHHRVEPAGFFQPSLAPSLVDSNKYTNYKPLGWKCRCNGHFYNP